MHGLQDALVAVLNRDIDIGKHFGRVANRRDKLAGHTFRLKIENADPYVLGTQLLSQRNKELGEVCGTIDLVLEILTPDTGILANKDDFLNAAGDKLARLRDDAVGRTRVIPTADIRNSAEAAKTVASIRDLHISDGALDGALDVGNKGGHIALNAQQLVHNRNDTVLFIRTDKRGDLGQLLRQLVAVTRGHATAHDDARSANTLLDLLGQSERSLDALRGCGGKERARVDDDGVGVLCGIDFLVIRGVKQRPHAVGIDLVLGATKRDVE